MKRLTLPVAIAACLSAAPVAFADDASPHSFSANATLTTDYVYRGFTQTNEQPAVQGGFDYAHSSGFYAGVWGSSLEFNENKAAAAAGTPTVDEATIEVDLYAGFGGEFSFGTAWDLGGIYYAYPGAESSLDYDFFEVYGGLSHTFKTLFEPTLSAKLSYSPEFFGDTGDAVYVEGGLDLSLPYGFGLGFHVGHQSIDVGSDYVDWKVGLGYTLVGFDLELAYYDTDISANDLADERVVFSISRSF
jgi:uncharacterized protein (TIGR02001 family)